MAIFFLLTGQQETKKKKNLVDMQNRCIILRGLVVLDRLGRRFFAEP
jgi:hypothetical protein